ncbi:MAG: hypothetical protein AB7S71_22170 [Dongiaceae bacterium]
MAILHRSTALSAAGGMLALALIASSSVLGGDFQQLAQAVGGGTSARDQSAIGQSTPAFSSNPTPALGSPTPAFGSTATPAFGRSPTSAFGNGSAGEETGSGSGDATVGTGDQTEGAASAAPDAAVAAEDGVAAPSASARTSSARSVTAEGRASVNSRVGDGTRALRTTRRTDVVVDGAGGADFRMLPAAPTGDRTTPAFIITNGRTTTLPAGALQSGTITLP